MNPSGWGYDLAFPKLCHVNLGVYDQHQALHSTGVHGQAKKERSCDNDAAFQSLWTWLRHSLHWQISDDAAGFKQLAANNNAPAKECVPRSGLVLADAEYLRQVSHRGGWKTIMQHVIASEVVTLNQRGSQLYLIDCCESYFPWNKRVMKKNWVGMLHYTPDLPLTFPQFEKLQGVLAAKSFRESLPWCQALIVFSQRSAEFLRDELPGIKVFVLKHPIGLKGEPRQFDLERFKARSASWKLAMVGQQYRRLSTLVSVQAKYPKVWLPGDRTLTKKNFAQRYERDASAPENPDLDSFSIYYTNNYTEYDDFMLHNIIILDVFDAAANNAVMEAIAMANPIFVRRHNSIAEYLGTHYPLFFEGLEDLEDMIASESSVIRYMSAAHQYLKELPYKRDFSLQSFASSLQGIASKLERALASEARKEHKCAMWQRGPKKSCGRLPFVLPASAAPSSCKRDAVDCEVKSAVACAARCRQHPKCNSFIMSASGAGCELCTQSSRSTTFLPNRSYHQMSCWDETRGDE
eukprot:TRINITY_DN3295_c0_g1_i14.p1 TRINITY_DN3295_c0_g1~~TRINITY_DN3295_c0_g1_i14.p1  ORF type:complete len:521 (+),score=86.94 TRINITY_DN3295_c0_g1_i14:1818-3380(+)